jgi:chemotaxis protein methyltransferase CheR
MAEYAEDRVRDIPTEMLKHYFLKHKDPAQKKVRVIPALRSKVNFIQLNFMDDHYPVGRDFDVIFCRNVLIYFDRPTQEQVICKLAARLRKGGYFFLGHSESITNMNVPLRQIKPTIFRKT